MLKNKGILVYVLLKILNVFCVPADERQNGLLYILMWTNSSTEPFSFWSNGTKSLEAMNCPFQNCYLTDDKTFLPDPTYYDVILFNAPDMDIDKIVPWARSNIQLYVFVSTQSESSYPISAKCDNFFNYTWSYKLNSDIPYPYFAVREKDTGKVIAPTTDVHWRVHKDMKPILKSVKKRLHNKFICAAFLANCKFSKHTLNLVHKLNSELQRWGHRIDIFNSCIASEQCPGSTIDDCFELVRNHYYFYLAFENSFSEDYVTEQVLTAVENYAVPVVFGGANYSRFLPDGAYLNARHYTIEKLAIKMNDIIKHRKKYNEFLKFHRYYTYHATGEKVDNNAKRTEWINPLCNFCIFMNNDSVWTSRHDYALFSKWWISNNKQDLSEYMTVNDDGTKKEINDMRCC